MQDKQHLERLLRMFLDGNISRADYEQLIAEIRAEAGNGELDKAADHVLSAVKAKYHLNEEEGERIYQKILSDQGFNQMEERPVRTLAYRWYAAAAMVILVLSTGLYFYRTDTHQDLLAKADSAVVDTVPITPGDDKAVLTLADGRKIILDNAQNGVLARESGVSIRKTSEGQLLYAFTGNEVAEADDAPAYNTIETPAGGKYQVNLPDGSKVWLNSASSLRFPAVFSAGSREVELSGEAYFDVARDKARPFRVSLKNQVVEVLGTQFNINSYAEEGEARTTLIEGSVKVHYKDEVVMLNPGQQFQPGSRQAKVVSADTEEVVAWKNGYFLFKNENIHSVMRKISRWYDVEVVYKGDIPAVGFGGNISRSKDINEVLSVLQLTNVVKFKVEGRRITVMP